MSAQQETATTFSVGDRVHAFGTERIVCYNAEGAPFAVRCDPAACEPDAREINTTNARLVARALYLDAEDLAALAECQSACEDTPWLAPRHTDQLRSIIARAKGGAA